MIESRKPLRWGIVGTGAIARQFARDIAHAPSARLTAVASRQRATAQSFAAAHSGMDAFGSLDAMLASGVIDALYVATVNNAHLAAAQTAIAAGIPLLVEKPLAADARTARLIADEARAARVFLMEGLWTRHLPAVRHARDLLRSGAIGRLKHIDAEIGWPLAYDPESRFWARDGGGVLKDLGVYPLSLARFFAGPWTEVSGEIDTAPSGVDRSARLKLDFAGGAAATISAGFDRPYGNRFILEGETGTLVLGPLFIAAQGVGCYRSRKLADALHPGGTGMAGRLIRKAAKRLPLPGARYHAHPFPAGGLQFEIEAASRAIIAGLTEEPDTALADTLAVMDTIEAVLDR